MAATYRTGTYVAFHANAQKEPTESDIKYYNLLKAWHVRKDNDFSFTDSHEKTGAIQGYSQRETIERHLKARLLRSKNMILVIGQTTKEDTDSRVSGPSVPPQWRPRQPRPQGRF